MITTNKRYILVNVGETINGTAIGNELDNCYLSELRQPVAVTFSVKLFMVTDIVISPNFNVGNHDYYNVMLYLLDS